MLTEKQIAALPESLRDRAHEANNRMENGRGRFAWFSPAEMELALVKLADALLAKAEAERERDALLKWKAEANVVLDGYNDALKGQCNLGEFMPDAVKRIVGEREQLLRFAGDGLRVAENAKHAILAKAAREAGLIQCVERDGFVVVGYSPLGERAVRAAKEAERG